MSHSSSLPRLRAPAVVNSLEFILRPERFVARHAATHGRCYAARMVGGQEVVITADPAHVRRVFAAGPELFRSFAPVSLRALFGPRSVLLTHGPTHTRQRKLLAPPLTGARLRGFATSVQGLAEEHVARLRLGQELRALDVTTAFTLDVIVRTVFGAQTASEAEELRALLSEFVACVPRVSLFLPALQHPRLPAWARFMRLRERLDHWVHAKIHARREQAGEGEDVLSLLLSARYDDGEPIDADDACDQLVTLLLAGHETTAISLAACLQLVHRHPAALARLRDELDACEQAPAAVMRLSWLSAVIDETLRLEPVVTDVGRVPVHDFELAPGLVVPAKHLVLVLIEALHHDPELYPEPEKFCPERFLERRPAPYEYAPFGGGVRRCLGAAFSEMESKLFLASLLRRVDLEPVGLVERRVRRNITMGPKHGVRMRVRARRR